MKKKTSKPFSLAVLLLFFLLIFLTLPLFATEKIIEATGFSVMGDGPTENMNVAKERARQNAKRAAKEKAGVYVESFSEVKEGRLTKDEVRTISANAVEVVSDEITAEVLGGVAVKYTCHIKVKVDMKSILSQMRQEKEKLENAVLTKLDQDTYMENNDKVLSELKEQYKEADTEKEREEINAKVKRNEEMFIATQIHEEAVTEYTKGDIGTAEAYYEKAAETDTAYAAPHNGLGQINIDKGKWEEAIHNFNEAIKRYDKFAVSWNGLAYAYNNLGEHEKAIEYCQKAIELNPKYAAPWNNMGYAYDELGNYEKAVECYKKAIELDPRDPAPWSNLGSTYDAMGNYDIAAESCNKALSLNQNYSKGWSNLGYAQNHQKNYDAAISSFQKAIDLDAHYAAPWNGLAYAYNFKGKYYKALECGQKALKIDPKYANAWNNIGYAYAKLGRYSQSLAAYKKAVELEPQNETYRQNLNAAKKRL